MSASSGSARAAAAFASRAASTAATRSSSDAVAIGEPAGQPHPGHAGPSEDVLQDRTRHAVAVADGPPSRPPRTVEQDGDQGLVGSGLVGQREVEPEVREPHVGAHHQAALAEGRGDVVAVPVGRRGRGGDVAGGVDAVRGHLEVGPQVLDPDRRRVAQVAGVERAEDDDLAPCAGDRDVQSSLTTRAVQRAEVEREHALLVAGERDREQHGVALVALDVLEVLDEQAAVVIAIERLDDPRVLGRRAAARR